MGNIRKGTGRTVDPIEAIVETALKRSKIAYSRDQNLDFYLPAWETYIECKQFHSPRISAQMASVPNVIAIQGRRAATEFARIITATSPRPPSVKVWIIVGILGAGIVLNFAGIAYALNVFNQLCKGTPADDLNPQVRPYL